MNKKIEKVWVFVKEHKKEILIGSGIAILGGFGLYKATRYKPSCKCSIGKSLLESVNDCRETITPDLGVGTLGDAFKYDGGTIELWMDNLNIEDLGKLGEGIVNNIPDVPKDAKVWALLDIRNVNN